MEIKKIKVQSIEFNREFTTTSGFKIFYFKLLDTDDQLYEFSSNMQDQKKFIEGQEYEVKIETKQNRGGEYYFVDISQAEKDKKKMNSGSGSSKGWVRSRKDILSIISQSSYEAAAIMCVKINPDVINSHDDIAAIAKQLLKFVTDQSGLNSTECKNNNKDALSIANNASIVYQKALKIAVMCIDMPKFNLTTTLAVVNLTDKIADDINNIANGI